MSKPFCLCVTFALAFVALVPWTRAAQTKDEKSDKVRIPTVDGVDLYGKFYPCTDGKIKTPPTVLMLHSLGETSSKKAWVSLAETLQKKAAVMTFDFRGHGNSTEIDPSIIWKVTFNRQHNKGAPKVGADNKQTIEYKEFEKSYHPALINDIAACKSYLDRKNDSGACNTSSFIVIGADSAATLGAVWVNSEWHRHRLIQNPVTLFMAPDLRPEGKDIIACVWLSINSQFGGGIISVSGTLRIPMVNNAVPMVFIHSDEDSKGKGVASAALKFKTAKDKAKYLFTDRVEVKAGALTGMGLLQKSLGVENAIATYLFGDGKDVEGVIDAKNREWGEREFKKTQYVWRPMNVPPGGPGVTAKFLNDTNLIFDTYGKYAVR